MKRISYGILAAFAACASLTTSFAQDCCVLKSCVTPYYSGTQAPPNNVPWVGRELAFGYPIIRGQNENGLIIDREACYSNDTCSIPTDGMLQVVSCKGVKQKCSGSSVSIPPEGNGPGGYGEPSPPPEGAPVGSGGTGATTGSNGCCLNKCGNGVCDRIVCQACGECACSENESTCAADCGGSPNPPTLPGGTVLGGGGSTCTASSQCAPGNSCCYCGKTLDGSGTMCGTLPSPFFAPESTGSCGEICLN